MQCSINHMDGFGFYPKCDEMLRAAFEQRFTWCSLNILKLSWVTLGKGDLSRGNEVAGFLLSYLLSGWEGGMVSFCREELDCRYSCYYPMQAPEPPTRREAKQSKASHTGVWSTEGLPQRPARRTGGSFSKKPKLLQGSSKALLKAKWGRVAVGCCKLLGVGILPSCSPWARSWCSCEPPTRQCYYLFCNILSLCEWEPVTLFSCGSVGEESTWLSW